MDVREGCYVSPVCVDKASSAEDVCCLEVSSLKLFTEGVHDALLLVVANDKVVFEATVHVSEPRSLRLLVPSHLLSRTTAPSCVTVYVVRCGSDGSIAGIIDSGQVLVFPTVAAGEITGLFDKVKRDSQQYFSAASTSQPQPWPHRAWQSLHSWAAHAPSANTNAAAAAGTASSSITASSSSPDSSAPDAVTLYAYEHFMLPFIHHWAVLLRPPRGALPLQLSSSSPDAVPHCTTTLAKRLLQLLLDCEMWDCALLLLGEYPSLAEQVLQAGLELPDDHTKPIILQRLRAALPPPGQQDVQLLQQMRQLETGAYAVTSVRHASPPTSGSEHLSHDGSYEGDSELLQQVDYLQQARAEQEYLAYMGYLQSAPELLNNSPSKPLSTDGACDKDYNDPAVQADILPGVPTAGLAAPVTAVVDSSAALAGQATDQAEAETEAPPHVPCASEAAVDAIEQSQQQEGAEADCQQQPPAADAGSSSDAAETLHCAQQLLQMLQQHREAMAAGAAAAAAAAAADDNAAAAADDTAAAAFSRQQGTCTSGISGEQQADQQLEPSAAGTAAAAAGTSKGAQGYRATARMAQLLPQLVRVALTGFPEPRDEQAYVVYKGCTNLSLDGVAGVLCAVMYAVGASRSIISGARAWKETCVILLCALLFLHPYLVLQYDQQLFLRIREELLAAGRILSGVVIVLVALRRLPQPEAWISAVRNTVVLHVNHGLLLPICQQLRMPAAAASAAVRSWADALLLAMELPLTAALLQSLLVHVCALLVVLALDVWCRYRFVFGGATHFESGMGGRVQPSLVAVGQGREAPKSNGKATASAAAGTSAACMARET